MQVYKVERPDDLPLLAEVIQSSNLSSHLDEHFPTHGNWDGISLGKVVEGWLLYILSRSDHRLSYVEDWAVGRTMTLGHLLSEPSLAANHFSDDHLAVVLDHLGDDDNWDNFENAHTKEFLQVYDLTKGVDLTVRLDALIIQGFREEGKLFKLGYSKQHRPGLPQVKSMVASLDPLTFPLANEIVSGNTADDILYVPVIKKVQNRVQEKGLLYVSDCKGGSLETRSYIRWSNNYYLSPLSKTQLNDNQLKEYLDNQPSKLIEIKDGENKTIIAKAFEVYEKITDSTGNSWRERRIIVQSNSYLKSQIKNLGKKIEKSKKELTKSFEKKSGRKHPENMEQAQEKAKNILTKNGVFDFFDYTISETVKEKKIGSHKGKPERIETKKSYQIDFAVKEKQLNEHKQFLGWRVYATNAKKKRLNTKQVVECYRAEYKIEHLFNKLLNKVVALVPVFLQKDIRVKGLIRLLLLALKFDSIIQHQVRENLEGKEIKGIYPGNPGRVTKKPTTQLLLYPFREISLIFFKNEKGESFTQLMNLDNVQSNIIQLLGFDNSVYQNLENISIFDSQIIET